MPRHALLIALALAACAPLPCPHPAGPACLRGIDVPAAFAEEVARASRKLGLTPTVEIHGSPFMCGARAAVGCTWDPLHVEVTYAPDLGFGPAIGSTALEHELCHAAGLMSESAADACAALLVKDLQ